MTPSPPDPSQEPEGLLHPQFIEALTKLAALGEKVSDTPEFRDCLSTAILHAPKTLRESLVTEFRKQGVSPTPDFYTQEGEGLHSIEKVAKHSGLSVERIRAELAKLAEKYPDAVLEDEDREGGQRVQ